MIRPVLNTALAVVVAMGFGALGAAAQGKRAPAPRVPTSVPAPFREAVGAVLADGLEMAETKEIRAAGGDYYVVIYEYPEKDEERGGQRSLRVYYLPDGSKTVKATDLYDESHIDFGTYDDPNTVFADVNKDGATDMIVSVANGGNCWQCSRVLLYSLDGPELRYFASEPMALKDLDGDGRMELLVGDTRWEGYDDFSHAAAPGGTLVYKWGAGNYVFAGSDAAAFYRDEMARIEADLPEAIKGIDASMDFGDEQYVGAAISMYLIAVYTGQRDSGREVFTRMMNEHALNDAMRQHRKRILDDFLTGESAGLLEHPKKGEVIAKPTNDSNP